MLISTPARASSRGPSDRSRHQSGPDRGGGHHESPRKQQQSTQRAPVSPSGRPPVPPPAAQVELPGDADDLPPNWELAHTPEGHVYFIE